MTETGPQASPAPRTPDEEAARWQDAKQLRQQRPAWLVIWLARIGQFRAYPLFRARPGTVLSAATTGELAAQMDHAEQAAARPRALSAPMCHRRCRRAAPRPDQARQ
jgi:hypothetical protein